MKVVHLNYSCSDGSGNAVRRLNDALKDIGVDSEFVFYKPYSRETARIGWLERKTNGILNILFDKVFKLGLINIMPSSLLKTINQSDADVIHLHWINAEMLSIEQIPKINKPLAWTFHDMWPICGTESYVEDDCFTKGEEGFSGLSRWVWKRKWRALERLRRRIAVVTPSSWMSTCARNSALFCDSDVTTLFNCMNLDVFRPMDDKRILRGKYGLPMDKKVVLFGAFDVDIPRKGGDLLAGALSCLGGGGDVVLAVFGRDGNERIAGFDTVWLGRIEGDMAMAEVCNCADVALVPSRQETFGQTASEPLACGVPVVAFDVAGLKDIIDHKVTGYLASPFDIKDFARGVEWVLNDATADELGKNARLWAEKFIDNSIVAYKALAVYERVLGE